MPDYLVILRPERAEAPPPRRLARALKFAGRGCRLRCVHVDEFEPGDVAGVIGALQTVRRRNASNVHHQDHQRRPLS